jgi:hypothetical protein
MPFATGVGNPVGAVNVADGGAPRIIGGYARENISGGVLVFASGADNVVSSGTNSFVTADILFAMDASGAQFNGVALGYAGSNEPVSIATRGWFILGANGTVTAGYPVKCDGNNSVAVAAATEGDLIIGRAITNAGSEGYCIVDIKG